MRILMLFGLAAIAAGQGLPPAATVPVDYIRNIRPLLAEKCHSCHGARVQQAGLRLDLRQNALRGGDYGPVIVAGNSAASKLIRKLVDGDGGVMMPPTGRLPDDEIALLRAWIDQGPDFRLEVQEEAPAKPVDPRVAELISAVRSSAVKKIEQLLAKNAELLKGRDADGSTPLHHAAAFGSLGTVKLLLAKGAEVNAANRLNATPLFWAIADEAKVRLLLSSGADVNARTVDGRTPVYQAAQIGNGVPILRILLDKGGAAEVKTLAGQTPLMVAATLGRVDAVRLLLAKGADVNARSGAGSTALMAAAATGSPALVRLLIDAGAHVNDKSKRNETALAFAATAGNEETVRLLLDRGADVNVRDLRGYSALLYAAGSDAMKAGVVKALLDKGADRSAKGDDETATMLAVKRGDTAVARLLGATEQERLRLGVAPVPEGSGAKKSIAEAVKPALTLLAEQSKTFIRVGGCNSCHAQDLPAAAFAVARKQGLPTPPELPQLPRHMEALSADRLLHLAALGPGGVAWQLFDLGMNGVARDEYTDAAVHYIRVMQLLGGQWETRENRRPPMTSGSFQLAALSIYAMQTYGRPDDQSENARAIAKAVEWMSAAKPEHNQDRAFHVLGLAWAQAKPAVIAAAAQELVAQQRADGGWSQLPTMGSDAYATGEALYALAAAGTMKADHPVYQKGVDYLLRTQAPDGSWHVRSRSIWLQPYFESGFPYGHDQWISAAGTAWATMALAMSVDAPKMTGRPQEPGKVAGVRVRSRPR